MSIAQSLLKELDAEAQATRRVLERVPDAHLGWRPHPKSRTLGELAMHIARVPGAVARLVASPSPAQVPSFGDTRPTSAAELLPALEDSLAQARQAVGGLDDAAMLAPWQMARGERVLLEQPRVAMLRSVMLNHWYHHRGQLTVYLRELDVPVPSVYGPSADENPFL